MASEATTSTSAVGQLDSLTEGQILLPGFMLKREGGLYVDLSAMDSRELFEGFVATVFSSGARFADLDYKMFSNLLYVFTPEDISLRIEGLEKAGHLPHVRLASDIVAFPLNRLELYRGFKMMSDVAEYYFEQISIDTEIDGITTTDRAYINFDEFIAALWLKGARHGIDEDVVRAAIAEDKVERLTVARATPPIHGQDATLVELSKTLHRDDSPKLLPDGRVDLCHFSNRFPQVEAETKLVKKVPMVLGTNGWGVDGKTIPPNPPKDFDVTKLVGEGTRLDKTDAGEVVVVATRDGFLDIDTKTSTFSISEKIVSRSGISVRTTGNLELTGDEFEEHGEVQEKRIVSGTNMTFHSAVFGNIESSGGHVLIKRIINGGSVKNPGGSIIVEGSASRSVLDAGDGTLELPAAEGSLLIGKSVKVGKAICCNIVAESAVIERAEGSAIAAKQVAIGVAASHKAEETIVTMLVPDKDDVEAEIAKRQQEKAEALTTVELKRAHLAEISDQPGMKVYLKMLAQLKAKTITMTPQQTQSWQALSAKLAPVMRGYAKLHGELAAIQEHIAAIDVQIKEIGDKFTASLADIKCEITSVSGETVVRRRLVKSDAPCLGSLPQKELHLLLREAATGEDRIFSGDGGTVAWAPPAEDSSDSG